MSQNANLSNGLMIVATACLVLVTGLVVWRDFLSVPSATTWSPSSIEDPLEVDDWETLIEAGHRMGPPDAPVTILAFMDFECPACRGFATGTLPDVLDMHREEVAYVFRHWPLPYHRFAYPAARAAECAAAQGSFEAYHDLLFAKQDSLGLKSFVEFAAESGVPDTTAFAECASKREPVATISADSAAALAVGGRGTPTVVVNGMRIPFVPGTEYLDRMVRDMLGTDTDEL